MQCGESFFYRVTRTELVKLNTRTDAYGLVDPFARRGLGGT